MRLEVKDRYLYNEGKPFFYLGDTAWLLFDKLSEEDIILYLKNRKSLGYNVIQSVLVYSLPDKVLENGMPAGIRNPYDISYWNFIKKIIKYANELGICFALLPCWGHFIKDRTVNENNALEYAEFLAKFFKDCSNIIWVIGGDIRGDVNNKAFNILGTTLKRNNPDKLVTYHPFGRTGSYLWFNDAEWLDFNMFQSGHRRYDQLNLGAWDDKNSNEDSFGEDNWRYVAKNNSYKNVKPCLDAEPSYEGIVQGLHDTHEPYWEAHDIRRYAYWSVFEGACGFTYGHNAIIQFYNGTELNPAYGVRETWKEALGAEGGLQMRILKELFYEYELYKATPHPEYILNQHERYHRTSVMASMNMMILYTYSGDKLDIDLKDYKNKSFDVYFMNPTGDSKAYMGTYSNLESITLRPTRRNELSNDWIIILDFKEENYE